MSGISVLYLLKQNCSQKSLQLLTNDLLTLPGETSILENRSLSLVEVTDQLADWPMSQ